MITAGNVAGQGPVTPAPHSGGDLLEFFKPGDRASRPVPAARGLRILLVEDDAMLGDAVCAGLTQDGARVDWVRSLSDARLALVEHDYKAVLLDLGLPGAAA